MNDQKKDKAKDGKKDKGRGTVVVINANGMGQAPLELGHKLITNYLNLLDLDDRLPTAVCLYSEGVKLATAGSPVLEELRSLAGKGVPVVACTTCLNHFGLADQLQAGTAGTMKDIVEAQWAARKVITL